MQVIHFTADATDPLTESHARAAPFVRLAQGAGETHLGCLHLATGSSLPRRSTPQASALMTVHGSITVSIDSGGRLEILSGVGVILSAEEYFTMQSEIGGVMVLIQCQRLEALESGISTPERTRGQEWPGDSASSTPKIAAIGQISR